MAKGNQYEEDIQKVYIAYYGRAADSGGLDYWSGLLGESNGNLRAIISSFSSATEFTDRFGQLSDEALIDNIFLQQFGRAPDPAGRDYWLGQLTSGARDLSTITLDVLNGATGNDVLIVENKIAAAIEFTKNYAASNYTYSGTAAANAVTSLFDGITSDGSAGLSSVAAFLADPSAGTDPDLVLSADAGNDLLSPTPIDDYDAVVQGVGAEGDTADYFSFIAGDSAEAILTLTGTTADLDLFLYSAEGTQLAAEDTDSGDETLTYSFVDDTQYVVGVIPYDGAVSDYRFELEVVNPNPTPSADASNDLSSPTPIVGDDAVVQGVGAEGDTADYFSFSLDESSEESLTLTGTTADLDLFLYDAEGIQLAAEETDAGDETLTYSFVGGTQYVVGVIPYDGAVSDYTLDLNPTPSADASNDLSSPTPIVGDDAVVQGVGAEGDTADYFSFSPDESSEANLTLTGTTADLDLFLYDAEGAQLAAEETDAGDETLTYSFVGGSQYVVGVIPYDGAVSDYTLDLNPTASADASNDLSSPTPIVGDDAVVQGVGAQGDTADYFSFSLDESSEESLTLTGTTADLDLFLYDAEGIQLAAEETDAGDETLTYSFVGGTQYVVGVIPYDGAVSDYTLDLEAVNPNPTPSADASNDLSSPTPIIGDDAVVQGVGAEGDTADYFSFSPDESSEANLTLTGTTADLDLFLYDAEGAQLAAEETDAGDETLTYSFVGGSQYVVGVIPYDGAVSDYTLDLEAVNPTPSADASNDLSSPTPIASDNPDPDPVQQDVGAEDDTADYFSFTAGDSMDASLTLTGMTGDLDLYLYTEAVPNGHVAYSGTTGDEEIAYSFIGGTLYIIGVVPFEGAVSDYTLEIGVTVV